MTNTPRAQTNLSAVLGLVASLVLASCSQTGPASSRAPSTSSATAGQTSPSRVTSTPSTPAIRRIDITVAGKKVTPQPALVNIAAGQSLTITVTSDHDDTLHAHGFNIEQAIKAGHRLVITVSGTLPGVYDIELHHPALRLLQVAVR